MQQRTACSCTLAALLAVCLLAACSADAGLQEQDTWRVLLPKGSQPEGIAAGDRNDIWVACLSGNIIHVNLATNTANVVHKERNVHLSGVKFCKKQQMLFVAGTLSGKAFLYQVQASAGPTGPLYTVVKREVLDLNLPGKSYINDVAVSQDRVYFTDSFNPILYQIPRFTNSSGAGGSSGGGSSLPLGILGGGSSRPVLKVKTGPHFETKAGQFRANGIAVYKSNEHKDVLLVANTHTGHLYKVVVDKAADAAADGAAPGSSAVTQIAQQAKQAVTARLRLPRPPGSGGDGSTAAGAAAAAVNNPFSVQVAALQRHAGGAVAAVSNKLQGTLKAAAGVQQPGGLLDSKWSKLAKEVEVQLQNKQKRMVGGQQPKQGQQVAAASAGSAAVPAKAVNAKSIQNAAVVAVQAGTAMVVMSQLAKDVKARMQRSQEEEFENSFTLPGPRTDRAVPAAASGGGRHRPDGFTARPSADAIIKDGMGVSSRSLLSSRHSKQRQEAEPEVLLAEPVRIQETVVDNSAAAFSVAATVAALAAADAQHRRALGRSLLGTAGSIQIGWPGQVARGFAERLGLPGRQKHVTAEVTELQLPSIPGQYTKRILVDGIVIKNDTAYVADNYNNRVWGVQLGKGLSEARITCLLQGPTMHVPTTLLFQAGRLWWVNAHLDTCFPFLPCPAHAFELHGVSPGLCQPWSS